MRGGSQEGKVSRGEGLKEGGSSWKGGRASSEEGRVRNSERGGGFLGSGEASLQWKTREREGQASNGGP